MNRKIRRLITTLIMFAVIIVASVLLTVTWNTPYNQVQEQGLVTAVWQNTKTLIQKRSISSFNTYKGVSKGYFTNLFEKKGDNDLDKK